MINVLFPMAGGNKFFARTNYPFPKPLIEICGKTMIEMAIDNFKSLERVNFIFILNKKECRKFHIDDTLKLLTGNQCKIIQVEGETKGAACSALMAIEYINNDIPLVISNFDQIIEEDINKVLHYFSQFDGGVIIFKSVHPRWSYVKVNAKGFVIEAAEKRPISRNAIAGFYYFRRGQDFVTSAMNMIRKDSNVNGIYYIAPSLNELVLRHKRIAVFAIDEEKYHTFYMPQKIEEYRRKKQC